MDGIKDKKQAYKTYNEKEKIINDLITILADGDSAQAATGNYRMFTYSNELDLIRGQEALIDLGFHCLVFADSVRYEFKRDYYEILSQVFNRDELKLTNVALCPEQLEFAEERKTCELLDGMDQKNPRDLSIIDEKKREEDNSTIGERPVTAQNMSKSANKLANNLVQTSFEDL